MTENDEDRVLAELSEWEQTAVELEHLTARLADERFTGRSASGYVTAEVDGNGQLLDITVTSEALRSGHPQNIGPDTVAAVELARAAAGAVAQEWTDRLLGAPEVTAG